MNVERKGFPSKVNSPMRKISSANMEKPEVSNTPRTSKFDVDKLPESSKPKVTVIKNFRMPGIKLGQWC